MKQLSRSVALATLLVTSLVACSEDYVPPADSSDVAAGTAADYLLIVDSTESLLADARSLVPEDAITNQEVRVTDLETSQHRMLCDDATSQYYNRVNLFLTDGTDEIALVDAARERYASEGWIHADRGGEGDDGTTILQFIVYSPCVANPTDKSSTWGLRERG